MWTGNGINSMGQLPTAAFSVRHEPPIRANTNQMKVVELIMEGHRSGSGNSDDSVANDAVREGWFRFRSSLQKASHAGIDVVMR